MASASEEVAQKAKSLGIKSWHTKSEARLLEEIAVTEAAIQGCVSTVKAEAESLPCEPGADLPKPTAKPTMSPEAVEAKLAEAEAMLDFATLMQGVTLDKALISVKCLAQKSKFFKYKDLIQAKINGN